MGARRFDVLAVKGGWLVTDSGAVGLTFASADAALEKARSLADQHDGLATVHHWQNGEPTEVYRSTCRQEPPSRS
jgi:hypothetical protein